MSDLPDNLKYAKTHEWVKRLDDNRIQVGITDFAQQELGDLIYLDLPKVGRQLKLAEQCAVVESVKTASDLYSPVTGVVEAVNDKAVDDPAQVNEDPYIAWLFVIRTESLAELDGLLDANEYQALIDD